MRLLKFSELLKRRRPLLLLRRVEGASMLPVMPSGKIVLATAWYKNLRPGDVVIFEHAGIEKIKRIERIADGKLYVLGTNEAQSTDSRHFGCIGRGQVLGKVLSLQKPTLIKPYLP